MLDPRLVAYLTKSGGSFKASGQLAGTAMFVRSEKALDGADRSTGCLECLSDLSYDLASGPFRVFGIDVKEAYRMAQKLYKLLKDVKELSEVV